MSGHSSFYTPETKKQAPIFTQTNRMDEQNQQTTPPAITYDPLWGFKEKKQDRPITLVEQDGANCGCFAAGMAVASLIRAPWNVSKSTLDDAPEKYAVAVAKGIEGIAIRDGLSAVGEMFDANSLVTAINTVLQAKECLPSEKAGKYMAKVAQFYTPEQLAELLTRASAMGVRVLIPYYSQNEAPAVMPDETKVPAEEMYCAHWGVMSRYPIGSSRGPLSNSTASTSQLEPDSLVHLYEGHETAIKQRCMIADVAQSNLCLGDTMNWTSYIASRFAHDTYNQNKFEFSKAISFLINTTMPNSSVADKTTIYASLLKELLSNDNAFKLGTIQMLVQQHLQNQNPTASPLVKHIYNLFQAHAKFGSPNNEINDTILRLKERQKGHPESFTAFPIPSWLENPPYNPNENLLENVNLRGQVILIGKKADASAQASQTAPAGGAE